MLTWQATEEGLSTESHSWKPPPARPSAKYHVALTGPAGSVGVGETEGVIVGDPPGVVGVGVGALPEGITATCELYSVVTQMLLWESAAIPSPGPPPFGRL